MQYTLNSMFEKDGRKFVVKSIYLRKLEVYGYGIINISTGKEFYVTKANLDSLPKQAYLGQKNINNTEAYKYMNY